MSDLDQAIREHLALKRQHGGDPGEVARQEREAFGELSTAGAADFATAYAPQDYADFDRFASTDAVPELRVHEALAVPKNEYAPSSLRPEMDIGEATQEYTAEDRVGWSLGAAWQGGAA